MSHINLSFFDFFNRSLAYTMYSSVNHRIVDAVELVTFLQKMCASLTTIQPFHGFMTSPNGNVQYLYQNEQFTSEIIEFVCVGDTEDEVIGAFKNIVAHNVEADGVLIPYYISISHAIPSTRSIFNNVKHALCVEVCGFFGKSNNTTE